MTGWYLIFPSGPITLGNLTPVGQNSGQVGCHWPPNGHHLTGCLNLPNHCQIWGPFWCKKRKLYVILPQTVYTLDVKRKEEAVPRNLYRCCWENEQWQVLPQHRNREIEMVGGRYLIKFDTLRSFWRQGKWKPSPSYPFKDIHHLPWKPLTLSHNRRENYQVQEEGSFFAEMTTLLDPQWHIAVKIMGDYTPPTWSVIGAGKIPVIIKPFRSAPASWERLGEQKTNSTGAILLTGALWQQPPHHEKDKEKLSVPYPPVPLKGYAADLPIPWQSWKYWKDEQRNSSQTNERSLTPGEWLTPAGAVYLWENESPVSHSGPFYLPTAPDAQYHRDAFGYAHLWLF